MKPSFWRGFKELPKHITIKSFSQGLVTGIAGWGFALMLYTYGNTCGWDAKTVASWIFACWGLGCLVGIFLACRYQMPISGAWSISGAAIAVSGALAGLSLPQLCAGYLVSGILVLIMGLTGLINRFMKIMPMPIVMGMTAGCLFKFGTNIVMYISEYGTKVGEAGYGALLGIALVTVLVFVVFSRLKIAAIPPVLAALFVVILGVVAFGLYDTSALHGLKYTGPQFPGYSFSEFGKTFVSVTIPLTLLVIGAENTQAIGVLGGLGYKVPIKAMTVASGIGGMLASLMGGHNANIAGPMTAMCAAPESGPLEDRYAATVVAMTITIFSAIFASILVPFLNTLPVNLVYLVAGLALVRVILNSLQDAFSAGKFQLSAVFAFIVALAQQSFFGIGSSFWSLLVGFLVAAVVETDDLKDMMKNDVSIQTQ